MDLLHVSTNTVCATRVLVLQSLINGSVPSLSREAEVSRGGCPTQPSVGRAADLYRSREQQQQQLWSVVCVSRPHDSRHVQSVINHCACRRHARTHAACEISRVPRTHGRDAAATTTLADEASRLSPKRPGSSTCPPCPSDFCFRQRSRRRVQQLEKTAKSRVLVDFEKETFKNVKT